MHPELTQLTHTQLHPPRFSGDKAKRCKIILGTLGMPGHAQVPLEETHLAVLRGLVHQEVSFKCANEDSSTSVAVTTVRSTDLLNCNVRPDSVLIRKH